MRRSYFSILPILLVLFTAARAADNAEPVMNSAPIVFFDIAGPDAAKLKAFYAANFGWAIDDKLGITTPKLDGTLRQDPPEKIIYIGVANLDDAMKKVAASGGTIVTPKIPIPTGTFALFTDPAGNRMGLVELKP
jgi:predicted enzyme related to lactoylglutathione lyase